jgi:hypothetical protein
MVRYELREQLLVEDREKADPLGFQSLNGLFLGDNGNLAKNGNVADKDQISGGWVGKGNFLLWKVGAGGPG